MSPLKQMLAEIMQNTIKMNALKKEVEVLEAKNLEKLSNIVLTIDNEVGFMQDRLNKIAPLKEDKPKTDIPKTGDK